MYKTTTLRGTWSAVKKLQKTRQIYYGDFLELEFGFECDFNNSVPNLIIKLAEYASPIFCFYDEKYKIEINFFLNKNDIISSTGSTREINVLMYRFANIFFDWYYQCSDETKLRQDEIDLLEEQFIACLNELVPNEK